MVCRIFLYRSCETALEKMTERNWQYQERCHVTVFKSAIFLQRWCPCHRSRNRKSNENVGLSTPQHLKRIMCTVEPPVRDQPKGGDLVFAYGGWSLMRFEP